MLKLRKELTVSPEEMRYAYCNALIDEYYETFYDFTYSEN